jgi:hypothetical protein
MNTYHGALVSVKGLQVGTSWLIFSGGYYQILPRETGMRGGLWRCWFLAVIPFKKKILGVLICLSYFC